MKGTYSEHRSPSIGRRGISITPNIYPDENSGSFRTNSPVNCTIRSRFKTHFKESPPCTNGGTKVSVSYRDSDEFFTFGTKTALRSAIQQNECLNQSPNGYRLTNEDLECQYNPKNASRVMEIPKVSSPTFVNTEIHLSGNNLSKNYSSTVNGNCENYPSCHPSCDNNNDDFEEVIEEEEIRTIRKKVPQNLSPGLNAAVGDSDINSVKVIGMNNGYLDLNSFSEEQLCHLEEIIRKRMKDCQPIKQDLCVQSCVGQQNASTMFRPPSPPPSRNVGMIFKPIMNDCGINTKLSCDSNDATTSYGESDEEIQFWFKERIGYMTSANQKLILNLAHCYKNDRDQFLCMLSEIVSKQKVSIGLECRPEVETRHVSFAQKEYSNSIGVGEDSIKTTVKPHSITSCTKGISVRPDTKSHYCNTENIMTRTQTSMACPVPVETVEHGMVTESHSAFTTKETNTERINNNTFHGQTPSEFLNSFISISALERAKEIHEHKLEEYRSKLVSNGMNTEACCQELVNIGGEVCSQNLIHKDIDATDPCLLQSIIDANIREEYQTREANKRHGVCQTQRKPLPVNSFIHNEDSENKMASSIGPVRETGTGVMNELQHEDRGITADETAKSKLLLESWEATTEYDEKTRRNKTIHQQQEQQQFQQNSTCANGGQYSGHSIPRISKTDFDRIVNNPSLQSDSFQRNRSMKMRDIPTRTEVVIEDANGVAISSNYDVSVERIPSYSGSMKKRLVKTGPGESIDLSEAHIVQHSNISNLNNVFLDKNNASVSQNLSLSNVNHNEFPYNVKFDSSASRFPLEFGLKRKESARQLAYSSMRSNRRKIPSRTYQYNMSESFQTYCSHLSEFYRFNQVGPLDEANKSMFNQLVKTWFDIIKTRPNDEDVIKDYIAILDQYSSSLLESVINSPDDNGSTALHYAVGHGSWKIVNILLNTQFMDVDKFNFSGYTPVMVSAISQANTQEDLEVIDKMLNSSNVDLRSKAALQQTPLILASRQGSSKFVELLLLHRASVNLQDKAGNTALMCAIDQGHSEVVRKLLSSPDIDLSMEDNESKDALTIAKLSGNQEIVEMITKRIKDATTFQKEFPEQKSFHRKSKKSMKRDPSIRIIEQSIIGGREFKARVE